MTKTKINNCIALGLAITSVIVLFISFGFVSDSAKQVRQTYENFNSFIDTDLEKNETLRLEILLPIGKTIDGVGTIFADESGEMWAMDDFYAEPEDVFIALMNDKGTEDKTDDEIVDIWLDLE